MYEIAHTERLQAAIMNIRTELPAELNGEKKLELLLRLVQFSSPVIIKSGGRLTRVGEEGITVIFEKNAEEALQCAFDIYLRAADALSENEQAGLSMGIHTGRVWLSAVKCLDYSAPLAISKEVGTARLLSETARKYQARILMTGTSLSGVRSFENRFSTRKIGRFMFGSGDELIYDVFDSDPTDRKYAKKRSRIAFETGVELFMQEKYLQARSYFIELLKLDRNDATAKRYVFMCDRALSGAADARELKYLEIW